MKKFIFIFIILLFPFDVFSFNKSVIDITNTNILEIQEYVDKGFINELPYGIEFLALPNNEKVLYEVSFLYEKSTNNNGSPK